MRCFYCERLAQGRIEFGSFEEKHIFSVNKFRIGEEVFFIDGNGNKGRARITEGKNFQLLNIENIPAPVVRVHLFVAPPRRQQMDQIIEQSSEVDIWSITPIITERSVSIPTKSADNERWKIKLIESCKQSHNPYFPKTNNLLKFKDAVTQAKNLNYKSYYGSIEKAKLLNASEKFTDIAWFVGPEGGFSEKEIEYMKSEGFKPLKLGSSVMRVETAAIAGAAFLLNSFQNQH